MSFWDIEFTAGGLLLYITALCFLGIPLAIWSLEYYFNPKHPMRLPEADPNLPIPPPTKIKEIRIYPIKSCRGFKVKEARLLKTGLDLDRQWMFVDTEKWTFQTIRQISKMTLIDTELTPDDKLVISIRDSKPEVKISVDARPTKEWFRMNTHLREVEIWGQNVDGWVYPAELTKGVSDFLGKDVRLVYKGPTPRILGGNAAPDILGRKESVNFADLMPIQISNQKSIDELNLRLKKDGYDALSIERFRPNIVVEGEEPWEEDNWKTVVTGGTEKEAITLDVVAHCARCQVPNVDPDTAVKDAKEPWTTLMNYRRIDEGIKYKPCFGMLAVSRAKGTIKVGMPFTVTEVTSQHWYGVKK